MSSDSFSMLRYFCTRRNNINRTSWIKPLQWCHNGHDSVSNHHPRDCFLNRQSSASFVRWIHRRPVNSPHKWPVTRKMFPFDDVIMLFSDHFIWHLDILRQTGLSAAESDEQLIIMMVVTGFKSPPLDCMFNSLFSITKKTLHYCPFVNLYPE